MKKLAPTGGRPLPGGREGPRAGMIRENAGLARRMKLQQTVGRGNQIRAHDPGRVVVNDTAYTRSVVVLRDRVIDDLLPETIDELRAEHFERVAGLGLEVVLLGTGDRLSFPHPSVTAPLTDARIGLEVMDTPAACRTFNVLAGDDRAVAAVILMTTPAA